MRKSYTQDIFRSAEDYNKAVKGSTSGYFHLSSNLYDDIYPHLLRNMLDFHRSIGHCVTQYIPAPNANFAIENYIKNIYYTVLSELEPSLTNTHFNYYVQEECNIEKYAEESLVCRLLVDYLGLLKNEDQKRLFKHLIRFFSQHHSHSLQMRKEIPASWAEDLTNEFHQCFLMLFRNGHSNKQLENEILKYHFTPHPKAIKKLPKLEHIKVIPTQYGCSAIVFEDILFNIDEHVFLSDILKTHIAETLLTGAIFDNCMFLDNFALSSGYIKTRFLFKSCIFEETDICINYTVFVHSLCFENCKFNNAVDLSNNHFHSLYFRECSFNKNGEYSLNLSHSSFTSPSCNFEIKNCTFFEDLALKDVKCPQFVNFEDIITFKRADFEKLQFTGQEYKLENIKLLNPDTRECSKDKDALYKILEKDTDTLIKLGLRTHHTQKSFDPTTFQIDYNTGWLKNKDAARVAGLKVSTFNKKRMADRKKITRATIPFRGTGKNTLYPVDALLAFRAQDWEKLKELRKKYKFSVQN